MYDYRYLAVLAEDPDGGMNATFPDVPEAITFGENRADALRSAAEALGLALRGYLAKRRDLPEAISQGLEMVCPHADEALKIAFIETFRQSGMSTDEFRGLSGLKSWEVDALLDPDRINDIAEMEYALSVLGRRPRLVVEAA